MDVEHPQAAQADGRTDLNSLRPSRSMDSKLAASIAVEGQIAIANGAAGSAQLPPLTRLMGHIDQMTFLLKMAKSPIGVGVLGSLIATDQVQSFCSPAQG